MTVGDEIILMRSAERPDLIGYRGRIIDQDHGPGLPMFRIKVAGCVLPGWFSAAQHAPGATEKGRK